MQEIFKDLTKWLQNNFYVLDLMVMQAYTRVTRESSPVSVRPAGKKRQF